MNRAIREGSAAPNLRPISHAVMIADCRSKIMVEIDQCRIEQDMTWGGPGHDDTHTSHDWIAYIVKHLGRAVMWPFSMTTFRRQMVIVAALAVAAIEWCDRAIARQGSGG